MQLYVYTRVFYKYFLYVQLRWEWQLKHLRRVHWHKNVHKLEVEPGRYAPPTSMCRIVACMHYSMLLLPHCVE